MILLNRAYRHQMQGEIGYAIELYQRSIETHPTAEAHTYLGWAFSMMGRTDEAIEECEKAITVDPTFGNPYHDIGRYKMDQGDIEEAVGWLERSLEAERYDTPQLAFLNLGLASESLGKARTALKYYNDALQLDPLFRPALNAKRLLLGRLN